MGVVPTSYQQPCIWTNFRVFHLHFILQDMFRVRAALIDSCMFAEREMLYIDVLGVYREVQNLRLSQHL
jgi:hypothetical protein